MTTEKKVAKFSFLNEKSYNKIVIDFNLGKHKDLLICQPRVEVTSCFVYKGMGLTFHDGINTQFIYRIEVAQVVARRNT